MCFNKNFVIKRVEILRKKEHTCSIYDLEMAHDKINREGLHEVLTYLLMVSMEDLYVIKMFYSRNNAYMRVNDSMSGNGVISE